MQSIAFHLGPLTVYWYGICVATGFICASLLMYRNRKYAGITPDNISDITFIAIITGILGARIFYVVQFWSYYQYRMDEIVRIDRGGLVFYGGFICATISILSYCRFKKIAILKVMDVISPSMALGHGLGRLGCFMNGCCYGKPTELFFGIRFPEGSLPCQQFPGQSLYPVQLFEACFNFALVFLLSYFMKKLKPGQTAAAYFMIYGTGRFLIECLRGDHKDFLLGLFTQAQVIGMLMIPLGIIMFTACSQQERDAQTGKTEKA